jgi:hypothetical protein
MNIIPRSKWGAQYEDGFGAAPLPAAEVWLHHSVTLAPDLKWLDANRDGVDDDEKAAMRLLEDIGEERFGRGISYTFLIPPSGRIYQGHGISRQGAHTANRNSIARAICLVGDYSDRPPTDKQEESITWLLNHGVEKGWWRVARLKGGHRQAPGASTECPGDAAFKRISAINALAADGGENFMSGLTQAQQEDLYNRIKKMDTRLTNVEAYLKPPSAWKIHAGWVPRALSLMQTRIEKIFGFTEPKPLHVQLQEDPYDEETGEEKK